jgi:lysophospholipase L1-like esterase
LVDAAPSLAAPFLATALLLGSVVVGGAAVAAAATGGAASGDTASHFYVALGDSVPVWDGSHSYPHLLRNHYRTSVPGLALKDMAVSGATTTSMLEGGQYRSALRFLTSHVGQITLITIDIGGNDIVGCASATGIDKSCVTTGLATVEKNLSTMLSGLRAAAPSVPLVGMTYYDPFLGDWLAGGEARTLALDSLSVVGTLNRELVSLYGRSSTAAVAHAFATDDDSTFVGSPWGSVPVDVDRACSWLDITCQVGQTEGFGDDPNVPGQRQIAAAFESTIGDLRIP